MCRLSCDYQPCEVFVVKGSEEFNSFRLVSELKEIHKELSGISGCRDAYVYIMNYLMMRFGEDTGSNLGYNLPELQDAAPVLEKLHRTLNIDRYDFRKAEVNKLFGFAYESILDKNERKRQGLFYTPEKAINALLEKSLGNADVLEKPFLKVLDPACGSGYFLLAAYDMLRGKFEENSEQLRTKYADDSFSIETEGNNTTIKGTEYFKKENIHYHIIKNCIYGADIDGFGAFLTKSSLISKGESSICCKPNVAVCNSLIKWEKEPESEDSELALFWNKKFDCIIGNPPWVSLSRKQKKDMPSDLMEYYRNNYKGNSYLPNLYEYFLLRSLELLDEGGSMAFVIPDRFAVNQQFTELRKYILKNYNIRYIMFDIKFHGVIADTMAIVVENRFCGANKIEVDTEKNKFIYEQEKLIDLWNCQFMAYCFDGQSNINEKMWQDTVSLKEIGHSFTGFIGKKGELTGKRVCEKQTPVLKGINVQNYRIYGNRFYDISPENIIGGTRDSSKLQAKGKILVRKTGKKLMAAIDTDGYANEQSLYGIIVKNESFRPKYVMAILNSKLMEEYYLNFLVTNINSTPQIKKKDLDRIPIKNCPIDVQLKIERLVERLEEEFKPEIQEELDRMIYELYTPGGQKSH